MTQPHTLSTGHQRINHLEMVGIVKRFPGVLAVDHVDFDVRAGEIHALLGENGAGKSTLMKILYGLYHPDEGQIRLDGREITIRSPHDSIQQGIGMVHQHFMLAPSLSVAENIALGLKSSRGWMLDLDVIAERVRELARRYNLNVNPEVQIAQLTVGEQQRVEILRALYKGAALLILDEPTAVLTPLEVDELFQTLRQMASEGHAVIFISHKLNEVMAISDRVTVLRDGRRVETLPTAQVKDKHQLAEMMVGRPVTLEYARVAVDLSAPILQLDAVTAISDRGGDSLRDISFTLRGGEIVGIAGVSGNGQHELAKVIAGLHPISSGTIRLAGVSINGKSPQVINQLGLSYIPEERMKDGIVRDFSVAENFVLKSHGTPFYTRGKVFLNFRAIAAACQHVIGRYEIKTPSADTPIKSLSGGNIQKLIMARELAQSPKMLIAAQPTRGVDIGASEYIHHRLLEERAKGTAILLISEDLDEILALSDRIMVMYEGRIIGELHHSEANAQVIGLMMAGTVPS